MYRFLILLFAIPTMLFAEAPEPVKWGFEAQKVSEGVYDLIYTAEIDKNWNVYSQFIEEGGPVPTMITYEDMGGATLDGTATEAGHKKEGMDPIFEMMVIKFLDDEDYVITQRVKATTPGKVKGYLTFMTCNNEHCLPPTDIDFVLDLAQANVMGGSNDGGSVEAAAPTSTPDKISATPSKNAATLPTKTAQTTSAKVSETKPVVKEQFGMNKSPVKWSFKIAEDEGDIYNITYKADIHPGWTVYSQFIEEGGPSPTMIEYEDPDQIKDQNQRQNKAHQGLFEFYDL